MKDHVSLGLCGTWKNVPKLGEIYPGTRFAMGTLV